MWINPCCNQLNKLVICCCLFAFIPSEETVMTSNDWVILLQAVMLYTLMSTWLLVSSTGVTSAALWRYRTGSGESSQMAQDYVAL